jgi:hypothetical protein
MVSLHLAALLVSLGVAAAAPARRSAGPPDPRIMEARKACAAGQVERGVELLAEIVAERNDPNAVYNQARCYQGNGRAEQALSRFREYLRIAPRLRRRERAQVDRFIRELEQELEAKARRTAPTAAATATAAKPPSAPTPPTSPGAAAPTPAAAASPAAAAPSETAALLAPAAVSSTAAADTAPVPGRTLRILSIAGAVVGTVALAGGIYYGIQASRLERELERRGPPVSAATFDRKWQQGKRAETRQWIGYGAAAVALGESAVLYLLARPSGRERMAGLRVAPTPVGGALTGRF